MNDDPIRVWVSARKDRGGFVLRWDDPRTGRRRQKRASASTRSAAYREAGVIEERLNGGDPIDKPMKRKPTRGTSWDAFTTRYTKSYLRHTSKSNRYKWTGVVAQVDAEFEARGIETPLLDDVTAELLEAVEQRLFDKGNKPNTVDSAMATLRSGLSWAAGIGLMATIPTPRGRGRAVEESGEMRGRPITEVEFKAIIASFSDDKQIADHVESWQHMAQGLWLSGLRISEAMQLHATNADCHRPVNLDSDRPAIMFLNSQKNRKDQMVAITPDFAEFLRRSRPVDGWYFNPRGLRGRYQTSNAVGRKFGNAGEAAGVITAAGEYATAHDLRRSFAQRWASRVMPPILQHLMRHQSIQTTMKYYVGSNADAAAIAIREAWESAPSLDLGPILCDQVCDQLAAA